MGRHEILRIGLTATRPDDILILKRLIKTQRAHARTNDQFAIHGRHLNVIQRIRFLLAEPLSGLVLKIQSRRARVQVGLRPQSPAAEQSGQATPAMGPVARARAGFGYSLHIVSLPQAWKSAGFAFQVKSVDVWAQHLRIVLGGEEVLTVFNRPWAQ